MDKRHKGTFHVRGYNDGKKYMRRCSMSLITREMQIKITVRLLLHFYQNGYN